MPRAPSLSDWFLPDAGGDHYVDVDVDIDVVDIDDDDDDDNDDDDDDDDVEVTVAWLEVVELNPPSTEAQGVGGSLQLVDSLAALQVNARQDSYRGDNLQRTVRCTCRCSGRSHKAGSGTPLR